MKTEYESIGVVPLLITVPSKVTVEPTETLSLTVTFSIPRSFFPLMILQTISVVVYGYASLFPLRLSTSARTETEPLLLRIAS